MLSSTEGPIPVYFSHSYRAEDRDLNAFFWRLFYEQNFHLTVDPKSDTLSVSYLELMMKQSACFAAVVTLRPEQERYRCSPYIVYEYGLAVQAQKPRLVFVENGVSGSYFPEHTVIRDFRRAPVQLEADRAVFENDLAILGEKSRAYRNIGVRRRGTVGFIFGTTPLEANGYSSALSHMKSLASSLGYAVEDVNLGFEGNFKFALDLDRYDFVILDVGPAALPPWVYPFIHGRFIPSIKLLHLRTNESAPAMLNPLLAGQLIQGVGATDDSILFWREENELIAKLTEQLKKFDRTRTEFESVDDGYRYFRSIGRKLAYVFISNANDANQFSEHLSKSLYLQNINHFQYKYQNKIDIGGDWEKDLFVELQKSQIFVALITEGYLKSDWCLKEYEFAVALHKKGQLTFIPFFLEDVKDFYPPVQGESIAGMPTEQRVDKIVAQLDTMLTQTSTAPAKKKVPSRKGDQQSIDIAIITILPEEYKAVLDHLDNHHPATSTRKQRDLHAWEVGEVRSPGYDHPYRVVLAMAGKAGTASGFQVTKATVDRWKPRYVLLVGIAGGRAMDGLKKGDVVLSDVIWGYEYGKVGKQFKPRHNYTFQTDNSLITAAQALAITDPEWKQEIRIASPDGGSGPDLKVGAVGSGDKVIDDVDNPFFKSVLKNWPKLIAIEMEGAGAAAAIKALNEAGTAVGFTMIRGISDMPKDSKVQSSKLSLASQTKERDTWKEFASEAAACFAIHLIRSRWTEPPSGGI